MDSVKTYQVKGTYTRFRCPQCGEWVNSDLAMAGKPDDCPYCMTRFIAPGEKELQQHEAKQLSRDIGKELAKESRAKAKEAKAEKRRRRQYEKEVQRLAKKRDLSYPSKPTPDRQAMIDKYQETLRAMQAPDKDKGVAAIFALLFGSFGVQFFYLDEPLAGVGCILFCWTGIPALIGIVHAFALASQSRESWDYEHQSAYNTEFHQLVAEHRYMQGYRKKMNPVPFVLCTFGLFTLFYIVLINIFGSESAPRTNHQRTESVHVRYDTVGFSSLADCREFKDLILNGDHTEFSNSKVRSGMAEDVPQGYYDLVDETTSYGPVQIDVSGSRLWIISK